MHQQHKSISVISKTRLDSLPSWVSAIKTKPILLLTWQCGATLHLHHTQSLHNCLSSCVYDIANLWKGCWNNDSPYFGREIGSDRTYLSEGQRYPFGKLFGSCFCCFKTTHQTQWRILENTNNLPQPLSCAPRHLCIYTEECTCSHTSVHASRYESNNESRLEEKVKAKEQEASGAREQWVARPC